MEEGGRRRKEGEGMKGGREKSCLQVLTKGEPKIEGHVMDSGEVLLIVDIKDTVGKHGLVENLGQVSPKFPGTAQCINVVTGFLEDRVVGHRIGCWRGGVGERRKGSYNYTTVKEAMRD